MDDSTTLKSLILQIERVIPLLTNYSRRFFTFLRFILLRLKVIFLSSPRSYCSRSSKLFSVSEFWPKFKLVTFEQKHAFKSSFIISSVILFRTSFRFRSFVVFSMYSHRPWMFESPSSAPPKSMTSHRSFFKSSKTCLYFYGISIFFFFLPLFPSIELKMLRAFT